jgi:hypothetical protein
MNKGESNMKRIVGASLAVVGLLFMSGCMMGMAGYPSPAGARPGGIIGDGTYGVGGMPTLVRLQREDVEMLGQISSTTESECILGLISQGDNGYGKVLAAARAKYPTCDAVINMQWDTTYKTICAGSLYEKITTKIDGTAIKYTRDGKR